MKKIALFFILCVGSVFADPSIPLHVYTVASRSTETLDQLIDSCDHNNLKIEVLGLGLPYKGNGEKLSQLKKELETIPDEDLVLFVDAYDCLILAQEDEIVEKFLKMDSPCVFSAEMWFCPHTHKHLQSEYPSSPTKFKYLNSGSFMAYAGYLKMLFEAISPINDAVSDQGQLHGYFLAHQDEIMLDRTCELFVTLQSVKPTELVLDTENKNVKYLQTKTRPFVVHGNGEGKKLYQEIYNDFFGSK